MAVDITALPTRAQGREVYVARQVLRRMRERGEVMVLRRVNALPGPDPYKNPPDIGDHPLILHGATIAGAAWLSLGAAAIDGRLVAGDEIITGSGSGAVAWRVQALPDTVTRDGDGAPLVDITGAPVFGAPVAGATADTFSRANAFPTILVVPSDPTADPTTIIGQPARVNFTSDVVVWGREMSRQETTEMGWMEADTAAIALAALNIGIPPAVKDMLFINGSAGMTQRAIAAVNRQSVNGVDLLYQVQVR